MRALLWKDYRQNRKMLIAVGVFLLIPYAIAIIAGTVERLRLHGEYDSYTTVSWNQVFFGASLWSLILLVPACGFIGGNAVAGERVDRSAEFTAYLPISRRSAIISKALLAIGACVVAALVNAGIAYVTTGWWLLAEEVRELRDVRMIGEAVWFGGATVVLIFGISWLVSTLTNSPPISAASGIGSVVLVAGTLALVDYIGGAREPITLEGWYAGLCFVLGILGFAFGIVYYLRRVEP